MSIRLVTLGTLEVFGDGEALAALPGQPVRTGLLVYLAVEGRTTRDRLLEVFWPDKNQSRARSALSSTLYELGRSLEDGWRESSGEMVSTTDLVSADAREFADAVSAGHHARAVELYGGAFLDGTHLVSTSGFESWVDRSRSYFARLHRKARSGLVTARMEAGDLEAALTVAQEWTDLEPLEDEAHHRCIELLARTGRPSAAVARFEDFRDQLAAELELEPMEDMVRLVERIRVGELVGAPAKPVPEIDAAPPEAEPGDASEAVEAPAAAAPERGSEPVAAGPDREVETVAVVPFLNMSPEPENEYFSDGMTEELISALSSLDGLRLAAATSSFSLKGTSHSVREIGELLGVDWVVEGSVRKAGDRLRISAHLVSAEDGYELWSGRYDRTLEDVFRIQNEIAWAITDSLGPHLGQDRTRIVRRQTGVAEAYDLYLMGRYFFATRTPGGLEQAIGYYRRALELDPEYALAHSGLADVYTAQALFVYEDPREVAHRAEEAAARAMELAPNLAEVQVSHAHVADSFDWDWRGAEKGYRKAVELDPTYAHARIQYGEFLTAMGRHDESRAQSTRAAELEPLSVPITFQRGSQRYRARRPQEALRFIQRAIQMDPGYLPAHVFRSLTLTAMGRTDEAADAISSVLQSFHHHPGLLTARGFALATGGRHEEARDVLHFMEKMREQRYVPALLSAIVQGALGEVNEAFDSLCRGLEERYGQIIFLAVDPLYDSLSDDPRFAGILEEMGLDRVVE